MYTDQEKQVLAEYHRRHQKQDVLKGLFPLQREVITDPARFKAVLNSRRSGKSFLSARYLFKAAKERPNSVAAYVAPTRAEAKRIIWPLLLDINKDFDLRGEVSRTDLNIRLQNGSTIWVTGADHEDSVNRLRGLAYSLVIIDEAAYIGSFMQAFIERVIEPALEEYQGTLLHVGTPGMVCRGFFYNVTTQPEKYGYKLWKWAQLDNPKYPLWAKEADYKPVAEKWLAALKVRKGWTDQSIEYQTEYLGNWVQGKDNFVYHPDENNIDENPPTDDLQYVLGVDLGYHDATAFVIVGFDQFAQKCYHIKDYAYTKILYPQVASEVERLLEIYDFESVKVDTAGGGSKILQETLVAEFSQRYNIPIEAADKQKKQVFMRLLDQDIQAGRMYFKTGKLYDQVSLLQWDDHQRREREGQECDLADGLLYAWREAYHWLKEDRPEEKPAEMRDGDWRIELERREYFQDLKEQKEELEGLDDDDFYDTWDD